MCADKFVLSAKVVISELVVVGEYFYVAAHSNMFNWFGNRVSQPECKSNLHINWNAQNLFHLFFNSASAKTLNT